MYIREYENYCQLNTTLDPRVADDLNEAVWNYIWFDSIEIVTGARNLLRNELGIFL